MGQFILNLEQFLITYSPNIISIIGMIATFVVAIKKMKTNKDDFNDIRSKMLEDQATFRNSIKEDLKEQKELSHQLLVENMELKKENRELKTYFTKVRGNEKNEKPRDKKAN